MELAYHYTTVDSFLKLFEYSLRKNNSKETRLSNFIFWATSIYAMNDPQELVFGYDYLWGRVLRSIEKELKVNDENRISNVWREFEKQENEMNSRLIDALYESHQVPFVLSFSKKSDYLPMWKTYSNNATGICLGFNNSEYVVVPQKDGMYDVIINNKLHALDVRYGTIDDTIKESMTSIYKGYHEQIKNVEDPSEKRRKKVDFLVMMAQTVSAYIKDKSYEYESEMRLIKFKEEETDVHLRCNAKGRLIPYIDVPIKTTYLQKIIVGPCADYELIKRELSFMLQRYGINVVFEKSSVPYRNN